MAEAGDMTWGWYDSQVMSSMKSPSSIDCCRCSLGPLDEACCRRRGRLRGHDGVLRRVRPKERVLIHDGLALHRKKTVACIARSPSNYLSTLSFDVSLAFFANHPACPKAMLFDVQTGWRPPEGRHLPRDAVHRHGEAGVHLPRVQADRYAALPDRLESHAAYPDGVRAHERDAL